MGFLTRNIFTWGNKRPRRLCYAVGFFTFTYEFYDMTWATLQHNTRDAVHVPRRYGAGTWVVVSGANDPIGREFASRFQDKGFNLILVDSSEEELSKSKNLLQEKTQVETIAFNYAQNNDWQKYKDLCENIQEKAGGKQNVSILVNNVEEMDPMGSKFHKASDQSLLQTINLNTFPLVFMSRFLGPDMKAR